MHVGALGGDGAPSARLKMEEMVEGCNSGREKQDRGSYLNGSHGAPNFRTGGEELLICGGAGGGVERGVGGFGL